MNRDDETLQIFFSETEELLKLAEESLLSLESTPESTSDIEQLLATRARIKPSVLFGKPEKPVPIAKIRPSNKIIAIGASTGGTQAIQRVLGSMPSNINGVAIVQHMPARFTKTFAQMLDTLFPMDIKEAEDDIADIVLSRLKS